MKTINNKSVDAAQNISRNFLIGKSDTHHNWLAGQQVNMILLLHLDN